MSVTPPTGSGRLLPFSPVTYQRLHQSAEPQRPGAPFGQSLAGGRLAWTANGAALEVVCCRTGARRAAWTFGAHRPDAPPPQVTAVCGLAEAVGPAGAHLLAVGLDCGGAAPGGGGMVCVFDIATAAVVRAVQLPHTVTALTVLHVPPPEDGCRSPLQAATVAAVGTQDGYLLLLDLGLDSAVATDERAPGLLSYVTTLEPAVAQRRAEQAALGNHLCLPLNDDAVEAGTFHHCTPRGQLEHAHPAAATWVSSVHFVAHLRSIVVGLSFGCFQIWNLETLQLDFASRYESDLLPVVGCVFLEPENDPRHFVYLWTVHSVPAYHEMNGSVASAAMYALLYSRRQWSASGLAVYRGLEQAGLKLVYHLTTAPQRPDARSVSASCLLSAFALPAATGDDSSASGADDSLLGRGATCAAIAWEAWSEDGSTACTCLALFDLNRWYQAHMPHAVDAAELERCEYMRFFSLDVSSGIVMGVSVRRIEARSGLLSVCALLDVGVLSLTFAGFEERLLRGLEADGGAQLAQPMDAYQTARRAGLVPAGAVTPAEQRGALLTLALERGFSSLIVGCAATWCSGDADAGGCTLPALLDWLWLRAMDVVSKIDTACVGLFDLSGDPLPNDELAALHGLRSQLDGLGHVLKTMTTRATNTDVGLAELESKRYVLSVRGLHASLILWLCHAGLLPEQPEADDVGPLALTFPADTLAVWFSDRRRQLGPDLLMIDGLVEELGEPLRRLWDEEDGGGEYPPRSLHALTQAYLLDGVPDVRKHRITHYLLMDLTRLLSEEVCGSLRSFPSSFAMSPSLIKLTHAFWHLDHGNVDSALVFLLDPLVQPADVSVWQHRRIVESLLAQHEPRAAMQYARARHMPAPQLADMKLHLRVLLDNALVVEAVKYELAHRSLGGEKLVDWLLTGCQERRLLVQLMRLPLDPLVERLFVDFLMNNAEKDCRELLHVFYLQRGQYRDAVMLQRRLATAAAPLDPERAGFRDSLHQLLPGLIHHRFAEDLARRPVWEGQLGAPRRPLSAQLYQVPATVRSRSTLIKALLEQSVRPPPAATPSRPRDQQRRQDEQQLDAGTPRLAARPPLSADVRRLLQTPPVKRRSRRSDVLDALTPRGLPPAAQMTPQSILKVRRFLDDSGGARGEDTPSKQLRFGRRSLEHSRQEAGNDTTPPQPLQLKSLFTPGKTPRLPEPRRCRLSPTGLTMADVWAAVNRSSSPERVSPPRERQSLASVASDLDNSEYFSFEGSPTAQHNETAEIFDRDRQLRLRERSWLDNSDRAMPSNKESPDKQLEDGQATVSEDQGRLSPMLSDERNEECAAPRRQDPRQISPTLPQKENRELVPETVPDEEESDDGLPVYTLPEDDQGIRETDDDVHVRVDQLAHSATLAGLGCIETPRFEVVPSVSTPLSSTNLISPRQVLQQARQMAPSLRMSISPVEQPPKPLDSSSSGDGDRRSSTSSGDICPLLSNQFGSMSRLAESGRIAALEAQVLVDSGMHGEQVTRTSLASHSGDGGAPALSTSQEPETPRDDPPGVEGASLDPSISTKPVEEHLVIARSAWVTGRSEHSQSSPSKLPVEEPLIAPETAWVTGEMCESGSPSPMKQPVEEPPIVREAAWVTGKEQTHGETMAEGPPLTEHDVWTSDITMEISSAIISKPTSHATIGSTESVPSNTADHSIVLWLDDSDEEAERLSELVTPRPSFPSPSRRPTTRLSASTTPQASPARVTRSSLILRNSTPSRLGSSPVDSPLLTPRRALRTSRAAPAGTGCVSSRTTTELTATESSTSVAVERSNKTSVETVTTERTGTVTENVREPAAEGVDKSTSKESTHAAERHSSAIPTVETVSLGDAEVMAETAEPSPGRPVEYVAQRWSAGRLRQKTVSPERLSAAVNPTELSGPHDKRAQSPKRSPRALSRQVELATHTDTTLKTAEPTQLEQIDVSSKMEQSLSPQMADATPDIKRKTLKRAGASPGGPESSEKMDTAPETKRPTPSELVTASPERPRAPWKIEVLPDTKEPTSPEQTGAVTRTQGRLPLTITEVSTSPAMEATPPEKTDAVHAMEKYMPSELTAASLETEEPVSLKQVDAVPVTKLTKPSVLADISPEVEELATEETHAASETKEASSTESSSASPERENPPATQRIDIIPKGEGTALVVQVEPPRPAPAPEGVVQPPVGRHVSNDDVTEDASSSREVPLPESPAIVRRTVRHMALSSPGVQRSRLSLLASAAPQLSPVLEHVGGTGGTQAELTEHDESSGVRAGTALPLQPDHPPAKKRPRTRAGSVGSEDSSPTLARKSSHTQVASPGTEAGLDTMFLRKSSRTRASSVESEEPHLTPVRKSSRARASSVESEKSVQKSRRRGLQTRASSTEPEELDTTLAKAGSRTRASSVESEEPHPSSVRRSSRTRASSVESEEPHQTSVRKSSRMRASSVESDKSIQKSGRPGSRTRVDSTEAEELDTTLVRASSRTRASSIESEEPHQSSVRKNLWTRAGSVDSEEPVRKSSRTRTSSVDSEEPVMKNSRTRAISVESEKSSQKSGSKSSRTQAASIEPELLDTTLVKASSSTRASSVESGEAHSSPVRKSSRTRVGSVELEGLHTFSEKKSSRARAGSVESENPHPSAVKKSVRTPTRSMESGKSVQKSVGKSSRTRAASTAPKELDTTLVNDLGARASSVESEEQRSSSVSKSSHTLTSSAEVEKPLPVSARKRRKNAAGGGEPSVEARPDGRPKKSRVGRKHRPSPASAGGSQLPEAEGAAMGEPESSPQLRRRTRPKANQSTAARRSAESRRCRLVRTPRRDESQPARTVVLVSDEMLAEMSEAASARESPVSRARRSSVVRARRTVLNKRKSVRL